MKYCINFNKHINISQYQVDEYIVEYKSTEAYLLEFLEANQDKRIILYAKEEINLFLFNELCKKFPNLVIKFENFDRQLIDDIVEYGFPFFYNIHVNNWDLFLGLVSLGVTDIYVIEDLCFELDKIAEIAHKEGIQLRTFPDVAQSTWSYTSPLKKFFIRPEDVELYEPYIDIFEFYGDIKRVPTLLKVYQNDKKWFGRLNEIIIGLADPDLDSRFIIPSFAEKRISCGKACVKGGKCRICDRIQDLSKTLEKANMYVDYNKKEEEK